MSLQLEKIYPVTEANLEALKKLAGVCNTPVTIRLGDTYHLLWNIFEDNGNLVTIPLTIEYLHSFLDWVASLPSYPEAELPMLTRIHQAIPLLQELECPSK